MDSEFSQLLESVLAEKVGKTVHPDAELGPLDLVLSRHHETFDYMKAAVERYYLNYPECRRTDFERRINKWCHWTEATYWHFFTSAGLQLTLPADTSDKNPDYVLSSKSGDQMILECKHTSAVPRNQKWLINNYNRISKLLGRHTFDGEYTITLSLSGNEHSQNVDSHELLTNISKCIADMKVSNRIQGDLSFEGGLGHLKHDKPGVASRFVWIAVDRDMNPIQANKNWLKRIRNQFSESSAEIVPVLFVDIGIGGGEFQYDALHALLSKQSRMQRLILHVGPVIGEIATKGVTVITRDGIHKSVMPGDLRHYLN